MPKRIADGVSERASRLARNMRRQNAIPEAPHFGRKASLALMLAIVLGGCAMTDKVKGWLSPDHPATQPAAPQVAVAQAAPPPPPPQAEPKPKHPKARAEKEPAKVAAIDPNSLIGLDPAAVEKILGNPKGKTEGDPSLTLIYSGGSCSLEIFFFPDLKTGVFRALKYSSTDASGSPIDSSQACIRNILAVRSNGPA
jgi:hypothetical protein